MLRLVVSFCLLLVSAAASAVAAAESTPTTWTALMPAGEKAPLPSFGHPGTAFDLELPEQSNDFRINEDIIDGFVQIEGFVVPLDVENGRVSRFLLVPYYGACIHTPPPPPNQIVDVTPAEPLDLRSLRDVIRIEGQIRAETSETELANTAYTMRAADVERVN